MEIDPVPNQQRLTEGKRALLSAVLSRLLPANGDLPAAGDLGLGKHVESDAIIVQGHALAMHTLLDALPGEFLRMPGERQDRALRALESHMPEAFSTMVLMAYNAYYTDQRVLEQIERELGYEARPPQPLGYRLKPFDEAALAQMRSRQPFWRQAEEEK